MDMNYINHLTKSLEEILEGEFPGRVTITASTDTREFPMPYYMEFVKDGHTEVVVGYIQGSESGLEDTKFLWQGEIVDIEEVETILESVKERFRNVKEA